VCQQTPENIFYSLIGKGLEKSEAESFGKTMALDMLTLYETAADKYFELGNYQRAFEYAPARSLARRTHARTHALITI
jgi:hypothetical protein